MAPRMVRKAKANWLLGFVILKKVLGGLIHILLIIALIVIVLHFLGKG